MEATKAFEVVLDDAIHRLRPTQTFEQDNFQDAGRKEIIDVTFEDKLILQRKPGAGGGKPTSHPNPTSQATTPKKKKLCGTRISLGYDNFLYYEGKETKRK